MKSLLPLIIFFLYAGVLPANAQCGPFSGNINTLPVCGFYGDASGNSNWNWELTNVNDPDYCANWYARTDNSVNLTPMNSPFVNSPTIPLDIISQQQDFTRAKGWELLRRDFGCSHVAAFPYFVLYNKYTGLMRVFVYVAAGQENFSGIAAEIKPNADEAYPAVTAFTDTIQTAPDKYLNTPIQGGFGLGIVSIGELAGQGGWSLIEFTPSFDPNIQDPKYEGAVLEFKIYGITNNQMYASIRGGSVTGSTQIYNYTYKPTTAKTQNPDGSFDFKGVGEKFTRIVTGITSIRTEIHAMATSVVNFLGTPTDALLKKQKSDFEKLQTISSDAGLFQQAFGRIVEASKAVGSVLKIFSAVTGLFSGSGSSGGAPSYTTYDLVLQGTITTKVIISSFVLRVPGTVQPDNNNATYYKCPLGIVNIKNTPQADKVTYLRGYRESGGNVVARSYNSYKLKNNLTVSFNDGAGLELISAQAAIVGEVQFRPDFPIGAFYDLFEAHGGPLNEFNHMRADLESGRLEIKQFDTKQKLHIFQTPYTNIECLNGLAFNTVDETKVYLQVKIVLKQKNDPSNTPIVYINNYNIETTPQNISAQLRENLIFNAKTTLPPYHNYTELPLYSSEYAFGSNQTFSLTHLTKADHTITTNNKIITANSGSNVTFSAGGAIHLEPGFEAMSGSIFEAKINNYGYALNCISPLTEAYIHPSACFNTVITAFRMKPSNPPAESGEGDVKVYPVPSPNTVYITGIKNHGNSTLFLIDQSGRTVRQLQINAIDAAGTISVDVSGLNNGVYFIKIQTPETITTRKIIVGK